MNKKYEDWIRDNVEETFGTCADVTREMRIVFPELKRVRGHYYCLAWGERQHWWLVAPNGDIVDPTADQFPTKGSGPYDEWDEGSPEPTGKCLECGTLCFDGKQFCGKSCEGATLAYLNEDLNNHH